MQVLARSKIMSMARLQPHHKKMVSIGLFMLSFATTLVAIFALTSWVELSGMHHAVQHVLIFTSGATAATSAVALFKKSEN